MKRRRGLLLSLTVVLALCAAGGLWLHRERQQYALNRALIAALVRKDTKTALALVNAGADPNTRYAPNPAPSFKLLLNQLLHHAPTSNDSPTALMLACYPDAKLRAGRYEPAIPDEAKLPLFRAMLSHGANINARASMCGTVLQSAIFSQNLQIMKLLLERGADANLPDDVGGTPLMVAIQFGATKEVHLLLAHGANPNVQDRNGYTALFIAVYLPTTQDVIPELLAHGADLNLPDKRGRTPLQMAQRTKRPDLVLLLKQHGAK